MAPKKKAAKNTAAVVVTERERTAISTMFERMKTKKPSLAMRTKCAAEKEQAKIKTSDDTESEDDDIVILEDVQPAKPDSLTKPEAEAVVDTGNECKRAKVEEPLLPPQLTPTRSSSSSTSSCVKNEPAEKRDNEDDEEDEDRILNEFFSTSQQPATATKQLTPQRNSHTFDFYLNNFASAINSVLGGDTHFVRLLDDADHRTIDEFASLSEPSRALYVRLFQRKLKWHSEANIVYANIAGSGGGGELSPFLRELVNARFLVDQSVIVAYDELLAQLKLDQLKELAKTCNVTVNVNGKNGAIKPRMQYIQALGKHFQTQKSINFFNSNQSSKSTSSQYMTHCKRVLGNVYKLSDDKRAPFVRILILHSLSSVHTIDSNQNGKQQLLQMLMNYMRKVTYVGYSIHLTLSIFENRSAFLRYQQALELEQELEAYVGDKDYESAYASFVGRIDDIEKQIACDATSEHIRALPVYLRLFTSGHVLCKLLAVYAYEVLQRLRHYADANRLFEFLLDEQATFMQTSRAKWFERLALNRESHLNDALGALDALAAGLADTAHVRRAGRLGLYLRLVKMSQTKRYLAKVKTFKERVERVCEQVGTFDYAQAPTVNIEGTVLHSEYIPGRKNIFVQNFEASSSSASSPVKQQTTSNEENDEQNRDDSDDNTPAAAATQSEVLIKNRYGISVEQVALTHYIKNLNFTNGKHCETSVLHILFGLLFWDIVWDDRVADVFVDRYQSAPLDLQSDHFYLNRQQVIDERLASLAQSSIDTICSMYDECWKKNMSIECQLVNWSLFESVDELIGLVKCFRVEQLCALCEAMSKQFRYFRSGGPDLIVWSTKSAKLKFVEVKGPGDRLSCKQIMWLDFFVKNDIDCEVCYVKGANSKRLRD